MTERGVIKMNQENNLHSCNRWFCNIIPHFLASKQCNSWRLCSLKSEIILRSSSKIMISFLSLIDTENTVQKVLQEFHVGLS